MLGVNTNVGALTALRYLNRTNAALAETQAAVNTGLKVAGPKDDGAVFAIAQNMRSQVAANETVAESLNRGISTIDTALSAGQSISDLINEMKQKALTASDTSLDTASRNALDDDYTSLRDQITAIVNSASFNGVNLVDGSTKRLTALASADGSTVITITLTSCKMDLAGLVIPTVFTLHDSSHAFATLVVLANATDRLNAALEYLAAASKKYSVQLGFTQKLSDSLTTGVGNLVDADMANEGAQLTALQTRQQLGVQALSIANQAPQIVLALFR